MHLWRFPENWPADRIGTYDSARSIDRFELLKPQRLMHAVRVELSVSTTRDEIATWDCIPNTARIPVVGQRLRELIAARAQRDVQFLPASINAIDGQASGFSILIATKPIEAIDCSRSVCTRVPGTDAIMSFQKLVVLDHLAAPFLLGRDYRFLPMLFLADTLKDEIEAEAPIGVEFERITHD